MDKAEAMAHASRHAGALVADARLVRHMQLLVLETNKLAGSSTDEARVAWQRMSDDDIIAAYAKQIR